MKRILLAVLLIFAGPALAQQAVIQNGAITPGNTAVWVGDHLLGDGTGVLPAGGTGTVNGPASSTVGHEACWANTNGTLLSDCIVPSGTGNVNGPGLSTVGHMACWADTTGVLLSDCGVIPTVSAGAWTNYTPAITGVGCTVTASTPSGRTQTDIHRVFFRIEAIITSSSGCTTVTFTLPSNMVAGIAQVVPVVNRTFPSNAAPQAYIVSGDNKVTCGCGGIVASTTLDMSGWYEIP